MATIVNTPAASHEHVAEDSSSNAMSIVIGLIVTLIVAFLLFYYGLPLIRSAAAPAQAPQQINNNAPPQGNQAPQINVPDKVNVDINPNAGGQGGNAPAPQ
jgi:hypothetical protein